MHNDELYTYLLLWAVNYVHSVYERHSAYTLHAKTANMCGVCIRENEFGINGYKKRRIRVLRYIHAFSSVPSPVIRIILLFSSFQVLFFLSKFRFSLLCHFIYGRTEWRKEKKRTYLRIFRDIIGVVVAVAFEFTILCFAIYFEQIFFLNKAHTNSFYSKCRSGIESNGNKESRKWFFQKSIHSTQSNSHKYFIQFFRFVFFCQWIVVHSFFRWFSQFGFNFGLVQHSYNYAQTKPKYGCDSGNKQRETI